MATLRSMASLFKDIKGAAGWTGGARKLFLPILLLLPILPLFAQASLVDAVKAGNHDAVHAILSKPAGKSAVNTPEADGTTALHWAIRADDQVLTRELIAAGANVNAINR